MQTHRTLRLILLPALLALSVSVDARAEGAPDDVIEVDAALRALPHVTIVPADAASIADAREVARVLSLSALFDTGVADVGASAGGRVVKITREASDVVAITTGLDHVAHRRVVSQASEPARNVARLVDAIVQDLTGTRSHLSGELLMVDASRAGERRVQIRLATGALVREVSPAGQMARGPDIGAGGRVYFAAAAQGDPLRLFAEGQTDAIALKHRGFVAAVAFANEGRRAAVLVGNEQGGALFVGALGGAMTEVATKGLALHPAFSPEGELAYAAGPSEGPLRVYVDDRPVSPAGTWASAPAFCARADKKRLAYMVRLGSANAVVVTDLAGGAAHSVGIGSYPACSADGRTVAVSRSKGGSDKPGVWLLGDDGVGARKITDGEASFLRWFPGPDLPPEG